MNKTEHLLTCVNEECSEVQKNISKILRFGINDGCPEGKTTNAEDLAMECTDLLAVIEMLEDEGIIKIDRSKEAINRKKVKVLKYMEYAKQRKTLI